MSDNFSPKAALAEPGAAAAGERQVVCRLSALGDVALLTGVLDYWRRTRGWRFTVLTKSQYAGLFAHHPAVEEVVGLTSEDLKNARSCFKKLAARFAGRTLLDLHASLRSRLLGLFWRGRVRRYPKFSLQRRLFLRFKSRRQAEKLRRWNVPQRYTLAVESTPPPAAELAPKIYLDAAERAAAALRLDAIFGTGKEGPIRPVILHPYATHARKEWPAGHWLELVSLLGRHGFEVLLVGQSNPLSVALPGLAEANPAARDLSNSTGLRELCAILERGSVLVTGDSGPMHLGVGVGVPVLALFGPTTREWGFFPPEGKGRVLELDLPCRPCSLHGGSQCPGNGECMVGITPETVFANILDITRG